MSKTTTKLKNLFILTLLFGTVGVHAQCELNLSSSDSIVCSGDSVTLSALITNFNEPSITTTFAAGNGNGGVMFDLVAKNDLTITSFDGHLRDTTIIRVYYKVGTHGGYEENSSAWTLIGSTSVVAEPTGTPTPIPLDINVFIPQGQTYGFYVTSIDTNINYTSGTTFGSVYAEDTNLQFLQGTGVQYPFKDKIRTRIFNGNIYYSTPKSYLWNTGDTTAQITVAPSNQTTYNVSVQSDSCTLVTDSITIDVAPPFVNLGADFSLCSGTSTTLDAGNAGGSYLWSTGDTTQTISVSTGGTYDVEVTSISGDSKVCIDTDVVEITLDDCTTGTEDQIEVIRSLYPNPVNDRTKINLSLPNAGKVELLLMNALGQHVALLTDNVYSSGKQVIEVDFSNIEAGTYYIQMIYNGGISTHKITKL